MLNRLKTLVFMQMENRKVINSFKNTKLLIAYIAIRILITVLITVFCFFGLSFFDNIMALNVDKNLLLFIIGLTQIISIITIMFSLTNELYLSNDNNILFSLPVKNNEILISKLIMFYLREFNKNLYFTIPLLFAFGAFLGFTIGFFMNALLLLFLLPLIPILIGAVLSVAYSLIKKLFKMYPYIKSAVIIGVVVAVWFFIAHIMEMLPVPLRLLEIYHSFMVWVNGLISQFDTYLTFYNNVINVLFDGRTILDYAIILAIIIVFTALIYFISMPFYFKIVCSLNETTKVKKAKKIIKNKQKGIFRSFVAKELHGMLRDTDKFTEYLISIISFPFLIFVMNKIFSAINTNNLGDTLIIGFNIIIGLMLLVSANTISAVAISDEGKEFSLLKTVPNKTHYVIWAKILINILLSSFAIILGFVELVYITNINVIELLLLLLVLICVNSSHILWSIQLDLLNPQFTKYETKGNNNDNPNIAKSVLIGVILSFFFGLFAIYFMSMNFVNGWVYLIAISIAFLIFRIYLLVINLKVYFKRLEF